VQRFFPVVEPRFEAYARGEILSRIAAAAGIEGFGDEYDVRAVSKRLAERVPAFAGCSFDEVGDQGRELSS
jgi:predicted molibdopterin-dependent oxidoreductase YjgC